MRIPEEINQVAEKKKLPKKRFGTYLSFVFVVPFVLYVRRKKQIVQLVTKINQTNDKLNKKLSKRRELILELVDSTKQVVKWDRGILMQITKLRNINLNSLSTKDKIEFSQNLDKLALSITNQLDRNQEWKTHITNHHLPKEIEKIEAELLATQETYNSHVTNYNQVLQNRQADLIAHKMGLRSKDLFES